jgi:hypothetical protein
MDTNFAKGRSKVSNGHGFLGDVDGRCSTARRSRDLLNDVYASIGYPDGKGLDPWTAQRCRRLVGLLVRLEIIESDIAAGRQIDDQTYTQHIKQSSALAVRLGLDWDLEPGNLDVPVRRPLRPLRPGDAKNPTSRSELKAFVTARAPLYERQDRHQMLGEIEAAIKGDDRELFEHAVNRYGSTIGFRKESAVVVA